MAGRKEIYTYEAPWSVYSLAWSMRPDKPFRVAIGSFIEDYTNQVRIVQLDKKKQAFAQKGQFDHPYPTTNVMWIPDKTGSRPDLLATTGDYLRIWKVSEEKGTTLACLLNNNKSREFCAPLTSFDWNETNPAIIGTSCIDTTCTIWDVETKQARTQLIAHDKEVYDIVFAPGTDQVFGSSGADGSVRIFDLRSLEHSTIIYESPGLTPLLRLRWNRQDPNYLATFLMEQNRVVILDRRSPSVPVAELHAHTKCVNSLAWAPHSSSHLCTGGDDHQALIWDLSDVPSPISEPLLTYNADGQINTLQWSASQPEWIAITYNKKVQILRV